MKLKGLMLSILLGFGGLSSLSLAGDSNSDFRATTPTKENVKGLIVKVARTANGDADLSSAEYKVDTGAVAVASNDDLANAWEKSFDVKGFGEVTKKQSDVKVSSDSSNGYYSSGYYDYYSYKYSYSSSYYSNSYSYNYNFSYKYSYTYSSYSSYSYAPYGYYYYYYPVYYY